MNHFNTKPCCNISSGMAIHTIDWEFEVAIAAINAIDEVIYLTPPYALIVYHECRGDAKQLVDNIALRIDNLNRIVLFELSIKLIHP